MFVPKCIKKMNLVQ